MTNFIAAAPAGGVARIATLGRLSRYLPQIVFEADDKKSAAELAREFKASFDKTVDEVKSIAEKALAEAQKGVGLSDGVKQTADDLLVKMNTMKEQLATIEQKAARGGGGDDARQSLGEQFAASEEYKGYAAAGCRGKARLSIKADITTSLADAAGSVGAAIAPNRLPGIQPLPQRRMTVRQLLTPGRTDSPLIEFVQETGFTNAAAPVAEGATKPQSDIKLADKNTATKVIAHFMKVSKQALSDVSQLRSLIDSRLLYGLALKEEAQLLFGDGTGENLLGLVPQATGYAAPVDIGADETSIDRIRLALLQAALAEYPATGIVMNPIDWAWIELLKDGQGRHIIGNPQGSISPTLWGRPVVQTQSMTVDKFLTGAFDMGAQVYDQWDAAIAVGYENDDFTRNKETILAEERIALAVYRPEAFVYGDFGRVA